MHIIWKKSSLNKQQKHVSISITVSWSFIFDYYFHFTLSFPFIPSSVLLSVWTFGVVSRCILNSVCNHSNFVNYYFIIEFLINTLSKFVKNSFMLCFKVYWQLTMGEDTPKTSLVFMNLFYWIKYYEI